MNIFKVKGSLSINKKNNAFSFSQWLLVVAFISGIVFTACAAQVLVFIDETVYRESTVPAPEFPPRYIPAEHETEIFAQVSYREGLIPG